MENEIKAGAMRGAIVGDGKKKRKKRKFTSKETRDKRCEVSKQTWKNQVRDNDIPGKLGDIYATCKKKGLLERRVCNHVNAKYKGLGVVPIAENDPYLDKGFTVQGVVGLEDLGMLCDVADADCWYNKKASTIRQYLGKQKFRKDGSRYSKYLWFVEGEETASMRMSNKLMKNAEIRFTRPSGWMKSKDRDEFITNYKKQY